MTTLALLPLLSIFSALLSSNEDVLASLKPLLPGLLQNTFFLGLGVMCCTCVLGVGLAWLTVAFDFPGKRFFVWGLMLPLAMPAYVFAFIEVGLFDYSGPVPSFLRGLLGENVWFPPVRSLGGAILALSLALYPYVYLLSRNAFLTQSARALEAARSLGENAYGAFFRVLLPMARPWIGAGLMLVLMESLADFGAVSIFNVETFTTAIYKAWFGLFSLATAAQLAGFLMLFALLTLSIEQRQRALQRYTLRSAGRLTPAKLSGMRGLMAFAAALSVLFLAFIAPMSQLLAWSFEVIAHDLDDRFLDYLFNTLTIAALGASLILCVSFILAWVKRKNPDWKTLLMLRLATLGYALPGTVLAVGIAIPLASLDNHLIAFAKTQFSYDLAPVFGGGLAILLLAYLIRFLAVGFGATDSAMQRITLSMEEASRSLGVSGLEMIKRVHFPLLKGGLLGAFLLVFVDIMKEMPITLLMRPFGWDSLAVRIFEMTSEGEWQRAALPAVVLVLAGLLPIFGLIRASEEA